MSPPKVNLNRRKKYSKAPTVAADEEGSVLELQDNAPNFEDDHDSDHEEIIIHEQSQDHDLEQAASGIFQIEPSASTSTCTDIEPPGPDAFAAWATHHTSKENDKSPGEEYSLDRITRFMGPREDSELVQELRRRRAEKSSHTSSVNGNNGKSGATFESVSYTQRDTPVWHNYMQSLYNDEESDNNYHANTATRRCFTKLRRCLTCACCCSKSNIWKDNPVTQYVADAKWVTRILLLLIGIIVSISGFCVEWASVRILEFKITTSIEKGDANTDGYVVFLLWSLLFGFLAFLPVAWRPVSAGSGIAEAKAVLNGIILPQCTELRTALCKAVSVILTSAASMPVGLEGPMIFMGLSLGENAWRFLPNTYPTLLSDRFRRDFAAVGTACGVASAFRSPVGGVLFAMEEGSSFWSVVLAWRAFGAACVTTIFSYIWTWLVEENEGSLRFDVHSLGKFHGLKQERDFALVSFHIYDYAVFALMGIAGGVLGACWCEINRAIVIRRNKMISNLFTKCLTVLLLVAGMASLVWWIPTIYKVCSPLSQVGTEETDAFRQFGCEDGEYNELGTLLLNPPGAVTLNLLFWEPETSFKAETCLIAGAIYFGMLMLCFGTSISMGIFIPLLYIGACFGRAMGLAIAGGDEIRTYAIVGSIALLAGVVRVLISLTTILLTCTGLPYMITPFMVATIFARVSGKWLFGRPGIYDIILEMKGIPFLEEHPPDAVQYQGFRASDIMSSPIISLQPEMNVGVLLGMLREYSFPDFPVTDKERDGRLVGLLTRLDILAVLSHPDLFYTKGEKDNIRKSLKQLHLVQKHFEGGALASVTERLDEDDFEKYVDLTPYVEIAHYTFDRNGSAPRAYELFRLLGLRSLVVTGAGGLPEGVITRYDLKELEHLHYDEAETAAARKWIAAYQTMS